MMAPRAMTAAVMGLPNRSQGEAAFLQRQCARVRSGNACGRAAAGYGEAADFCSWFSADRAQATSVSQDVLTLAG